MKHSFVILRVIIRKSRVLKHFTQPQRVGVYASELFALPLFEARYRSVRKLRDLKRLDIKQLLYGVEQLCPNATFTLELLTAAPSVRWLAERGILKGDG